MQLMKRMKQKKMGNKGFTLVELIIVMAIMAILLGIVGTQVIPYLNRAREAKDLQLINSYCTSAVAIYSLHAEDFVSIEKEGDYPWCGVYNDGTTVPSEFGSFLDKDNLATIDVISEYFRDEMIEMVGYKDIDALKKAMSSKKGQEISDVVIAFIYKDGKVIAQAVDASGKSVLDPVTSYIGKTGAD